MRREPLRADKVLSIRKYRLHHRTGPKLRPRYTPRPEKIQTSAEKVFSKYVLSQNNVFRPLMFLNQVNWVAPTSYAAESCGRRRRMDSGLVHLHIEGHVLRVGRAAGIGSRLLVVGGRRMIKLREGGVRYLVPCWR